MSQNISKDVVITDGGSTTSTIELELPAENFNPRGNNNLTSFSVPDSDGGSFNRRALNLNRIELPITLKLDVDDDYASKNHDGSGNRPNLSNKEDFLLELWNLFISGKHLELKATNDNTHPEISEFTGYLSNMEWNERANQDNSIYQITLKFTVAEPMNS